MGDPRALELGIRPASQTTSALAVQPNHKVPKALNVLPSRERFKWLFHKLGLTGVGVELGVLNGYFSMNTFSNSTLSRWIGVDRFEKYSEYQTLYKDQATFDNARQVAQVRYDRMGGELMISDSAHAALSFEDESVDFIYIDANHAYDFVKMDIEAWWPKLRKGGVMAGHDYKMPEFRGVVVAVNEFAAAQGVPIHVTSKDEVPTWVIYKPTAADYV